jgi:hypothetical protein
VNQTISAQEAGMAIESSRNSDSDLKYPEWQSPFREALLELEREKLQSKMMKAEEAIFQRLQQLTGTSDSEGERQAIEDAISALRVLKTEKLNYPDWESP